MELSIVIPCYNEEHNIPRLAERCIDLLNTHQEIEVILVNNGSTDNSADVFLHLIQKTQEKRLRVVTVEKNIGYGYGILAGLNAASSDILAWTHADLQTDPEDVVLGFKKIKKSPANTIVKGKRIGRRFSEQFFSTGLGFFAWIMFRKNLGDINGQPKIFPKHFFVEFIKDKAPMDFSLDIFLLLAASKNNFSVHEFPVRFSKRTADEAKGGGSFKTRLKLILRTFNFILKLKRDRNE